MTSSINWKDKIYVSPGYRTTLSGSDLVVYDDKILLCCGVDPFENCYSDTSSDWMNWPTVEHTDIVVYLVLTTNSFSGEQMKAYKSLEAHNYFTSGFVHKDIHSQKLVDGNIILIGKVNHSQALSHPPLRLWILAKPTGEIITAHCLCMAGCGSACSHVAAVLFAVATGVAMRDSVSCTQKTNAWLPTYAEAVKYLPVKELNFMSAKKRKTVLDTLSMVNNPATEIPTRLSGQLRLPKVSKPTESEWAIFFKDLSELPDQSAVLRIIPAYCKTTECEARSRLVADAAELFKTANRDLPWLELLNECDLTFESLQVTSETSQKIELLTRAQSQCKAWFRVRAGKITASVIKNVCVTDLSSPSVCLIKKVCYPYSSRFKSAPTQWGCNNEKAARREYQLAVSNTHVNHRLFDSGFQINPNYPFLGASPDAIVSCDCCGKGVLEVKCPFSCKDGSILDYSTSKYSCLNTENGLLKLNRTHAYYYQIQAQMLVCNVKYSDFVIWTNVEIYTDRVYMDDEFCDEMVVKAKCFYKVAVLPELLAKWYTLPKSRVLIAALSENTNLSTFRNQPLFCYCQKPLVKTMVQCTRDGCQFKYFHLICLRIKNKPKSKKWACPDCRRTK